MISHTWFVLSCLINKLLVLHKSDKNEIILFSKTRIRSLTCKLVILLNIVNGFWWEMTTFTENIKRKKKKEEKGIG